MGPSVRPALTARNCQQVHDQRCQAAKSNFLVMVGVRERQRQRERETETVVFKGWPGCMLRACHD